MIEAYRRLSELVPYPLHLGVTEAGTRVTGTVKCAVGIGALLASGIGDTIRVSLSTDPVEEVQGRLRDPQGARAAQAGAGADRVPVVRADERRGARARRAGRGGGSGSTREHFEVAVMGCAVNGRARRATPTSGSPEAATRGSSTRTARCCGRSTRPCSSTSCSARSTRWIAAGMPRPERGTRKRDPHAAGRDAL